MILMQNYCDPQLERQQPPLRPVTTKIQPASITGLFIKSRRRDQRERLNRAPVTVWIRLEKATTAIAPKSYRHVVQPR